MKKNFFLSVLLFSWTFSALGSESYLDRAPRELDRVTNLLKWCDVIAIVTEHQFKREITTNEIVLDKRVETGSGTNFEIDLSIAYEHVQPVLMGGYQYLLFLTEIDKEPESAERESKNVFKITGGGNGVIPLFNLDELKNHPRVSRMKRIAPQYDPIKARKNNLNRNFGTDDGLVIKKAIELIAAIYKEENSKVQAMLLIEGLREGNPAMVRLCQELLNGIELEAIDQSERLNNAATQQRASTIKGVCKNSGISVLTGVGPALGTTTNKSVDVTID